MEKTIVSTDGPGEGKKWIPPEKRKTPRCWTFFFSRDEPRFERPRQRLLQPSPKQFLLTSSQVLELWTSLRGGFEKIEKILCIGSTLSRTNIGSRENQPPPGEKTRARFPPSLPPCEKGKETPIENTTRTDIFRLFFFNFFPFFAFFFFFFLFCFFFFSFSRYQNCPNLLLLRRQGRRSLEHAWKKSDLIIVDGNDESRVSA